MASAPTYVSTGVLPPRQRFAAVRAMQFRSRALDLFSSEPAPADREPAR